MRSLEGKAVVITGAGRGIGEAYARLAADEGARVVVNDMDAEQAERVAQSIRDSGGEALPKVADVSSWDDAERLVQFCVSSYGRLDGLVNNAALYHMAMPEEEMEKQVRRLFEVNVLGTAFCGYAALRCMQKQGSGSLVNITSGAHSGMKGMSAYGGSKGAVASMTYSWALDVQGTGVRVNAVSPTAQTRMHDATAVFHQRHGLGALPASLAIPPSNNAPLVAYLLSDLSSAVNGQVVRVQGRTISLVTHPAVLIPGVESDQWTVGEVAKAFVSSLDKLQLPLGVQAYDVNVHPYEVAYADANVKAGKAS